MKLHKLASMFASTSIALSAFADDHGGDSPDYLSPFNVIGTKADVSELKGSGCRLIDASDLGPFMHTDIHDIHASSSWRLCSWRGRVRIFPQY
ncbi:MAG: hypothetical protein ACJZ72_02575 [Opitutales bacterium]